MGNFGFAADEWQQRVVNAWLAKANGKYAASRCGLSVPRQNGKNECLFFVELFKLVFEHRRILHTAHEVETSRDAFERMLAFFEDEDYPQLKHLLVKARAANGQEAIKVKGGGYIKFRTRTRAGSRGKTFDDLIIDEAQELTDEQYQALKPTTSAAPSKQPQVIMLGTPPGPRADGAPFRRLRESAAKGKKRIVWHEWSPPFLPDKDDSKACLEIAYLTNPALGVRILAETVADAPEDMGFEGFLREFCGSWETEALREQPVISMPAWLECVGEKPAEGGTTFAVKFSTDGKRVSLAVALRPEQGPIFVDVLGQSEMPQGATPLIGWLASRWRTGKIIIDGKAAAADFYKALTAGGVPERALHIVKPDEYVSAHAGFYRAISDRNVSHANRGALTAQVGIAGRKEYPSGAWCWQSIDPAEYITDLEAATVAFGFAQPSKPAKSGKPRRMGIVR